MADEYIKKLAITRLSSVPPDVSLMIGGQGFTTKQLIKEVENDSKIGKMAVAMQINSIRNSAKMAKWLENE